MPMTRTPKTSFSRLADAVAADGVTAHHDALADLAAIAYRSGVRSRLLAVLTDRSQPEVARERALGRVLAELDTIATAPARDIAVAAA